MRAEHWIRWHHGTVTDPKWLVVAARARHALSHQVTPSHFNVTTCHVIAVWAAMLECASQASPRGTLAGWCDEDVAAGLGIDTDVVAAIRKAMDGKTLKEDSVSAWSERQPKAEDTGAARRKAVSRDREKSRDVTTSHTKSRDAATETETETETEVKQEHKSAVADLFAAVAADNADPDKGAPPCPHEKIIAIYHEVLQELRQVKQWNETRRGYLAKRWKEDPERQSLEWWREYFGYVRQSLFLMGKKTGRDGRAFDCDLEWLVRPSNFIKVLEGKYEDASA